MYRLLEHTSDLEILVESETFEELVAESIKAITSFVATGVRTEESRKMRLEGDEEKILMSALEEIVYLQTAENFYATGVTITRKGKSLIVELSGGKADARDEIKAVTWHDFWVQHETKWRAHFICDL